MFDSPPLWLTVAFASTYLAFTSGFGPVVFFSLMMVAVVSWIRFAASALRFLRSSPWK